MAGSNLLNRPSAGLSSIVLRLIAWGMLIGFAIVIIYPLIWMILGGFKTNQDFLSNPWGFPQSFHPGNYSKAWNLGVTNYFVNSVIVTVLTIIATTLFSAWAAYGLVKVHIPFSKQVTLLIMGGMMLAPTVALIPLFRLLQTLHMFDTLWALIVLYTAFRIPFITFLIRAYMIDLPSEIDEAAHIDGASTSQIFWRIIFPISRPILISAAVLQALFAWNEFAFALVFTSSEKVKTLPVGLVSMQSRLLTDWPLVLAGLTIAALPMVILFLIGQKQFLRGLTEGMGK